MRAPKTLGLTILLVAAPAMAAAVFSGVVFDPPAPTWNDELAVTVSGQHCGADALGEPEVTGDVVRVELLGTCENPKRPDPFVLTSKLPRLAPGKYLFELIEDETEEALMQAPFEVFRADDVAVTAEGGADDASPAVVIARGFGCPPAMPPEIEIEDASITVTFAGCTGPAASELWEIPVSLGTLVAGTYQVSVVVAKESGASAATTELIVHDADGCVPSATDLCLQDDRFTVTVTWQDFDGNSGQGTAVRLQGVGNTGFFWFFDDENLELMAKVLDGCGVNQHYWVFLASGSDVGYTLTVFDHESGEGREYSNEVGETPFLTGDITAFAACP